MKKVTKILWGSLGIIYTPVFILSFLLFLMARLLLAVSYLGMLDFKIGKDTFKNIYGRYGRN